MLSCHSPVVGYLSATFLGCVLACASVADEPSFPYVGYVHVESAVVRSGPGAHSYTTDRLSWGTRVEVYHHDPEGWAGIRPPEGSFSWVPAEVLEPTAQAGLSRVIAHDVQASVGTRYSHRRDTRHVRLPVGEIVEVLGQRELSPKDGAEGGLWVKISPPAGEFRWLRVRHLSHEPPTQLESSPKLEGGKEAVRRADDAQDSDRPAVKEVAADEVAAEAGQLERKVVSVLVETTGPQGRLPNTPSSATGNTSSDEARAARVGEQVAVWESIQPEAASDSVEAIAEPIGTYDAGPASAALTSGFREVTPDSNASFYVAEQGRGGTATRSPGREVRIDREFAGDLMPTRFDPILGIGQERLADELARIHLMLTQRIVKDPSQWELRSLRGRAQAVIDTSDSADLRRKGHDLLASIAKFEDLQRRHQQLSTGNVPQITSASSLAGWGSTPSAGGSPRTGQGGAKARPGYDGKGWLMPVITRRAGTPHYALTDDSGNILQFVTPPRGMNLKKYERRRIAIYGQQGYLPQLNKPHLTAERIISLDVLR